MAFSVKASVVLAMLVVGTSGYAKDPDFRTVQALYAKYRCTECHGKGDLAKRWPLDDYDKMPFVVPGKPDESSLLFVLAGDDPKVRMPPPNKKDAEGKPYPEMHRDDVAILRDWITKGAKKTVLDVPKLTKDEVSNRPKVRVRAEFYRRLVQNILPEGTFSVTLPGIKRKDRPRISYTITGFGKGIGKEPWVNETPADPLAAVPAIGRFDPDYKPNPRGIVRDIRERIFVADGSKIVGAEDDDLPITCLYVEIKDLRYTNEVQRNPLVADLKMKVYLIVNDHNCTGPKAIQYDPPFLTLRSPTWVYYEVVDPATMLPSTAHWSDSEGDKSVEHLLRWEAK